MDEAITFLTSEMKKRGFECRGKEDSKVNLLTEATIAGAFSECIREGYMRSGDGGMFVYNGRIFESKDEEVFKKIICYVLAELEVGYVYHTNSVNKIMNRIKNDFPFARDRKFTPSKNIIAFRNCVLDLETMERHDHNEKYETRIYLDFDYNPNAKCKRWMQFLPEVINDESCIKVLQEFLGFVFVDKDRFSTSAALYLIGEGSNGKGVVYEVMEHILGDNLSTASLAQLCNGNTADYYCDQVNGKLLNLCSDMGSENFSAGGRYKTLVSREAIMVRPIHKSPYKAEDMPLLMANINTMPLTTDNTDGYWRRMKVMSFDRKFTAEDADEELPMKLKSEISGIFNWILDGRTRIIQQKGKFTESKKMDQIKSRAMKESDSVLCFLDEREFTGKLEDTQSGELVKILAANIYKEYVEYCKSSNKHPKATTAFKQSMDRIGAEYFKSMKVDGMVSAGYSFYKITGVKEIKKEKMTDEQLMDELPF